MPGYLEIGELSHLLDRWGTRGKANRDWRESYYFNVTDPKTGLSIITTVGMVPHKRRKATGFVIVLRGGRIVASSMELMKPIPWHETDRFSAGGISYKVEGIDWRIRHAGRECGLDVLFRPVNECFRYVKGGGQEDGMWAVGAQHVEQGGVFEGEMWIGGQRFEFGPAYGHRDHSWGTRDWKAFDGYWLFSCTFGKDCAFNLWKGETSGTPFQAGYVFDGEENRPIASSTIKPELHPDGMRPNGCTVEFETESGGKHVVKCEAVTTVPLPIPGGLVFETIARMEMDGKIGYGLQEHLVSTAKPFTRLRALMEIKRMGGRLRP